ncbi:MAG: pyroglutamyl-peptidase I [Clostridia bacterium]|nr:pyroglutamyl-peptidase I [Clostridia bacterium]
MKKILVTGFEPFGGETINPSWEAVKLLPDEIGGYAIEKLELPVEFGRCAQITEATILAQAPAAVVCVGQAGGRTNVTPERIGINLKDARIPDNGGAQPKDEPIDPNGPDAYFATLPVTAMVQAMREAGVPAQASLSAGAYVCNDLLYEVLHKLHRRNMEIPAGFVHVPFIPAQVLEKNQPSLPLEQITAALEAGIRAVIASL